MASAPDAQTRRRQQKARVLVCAGPQRTGAQAPTDAAQSAMGRWQRVEALFLSDDQKRQVLELKRNVT